MCVFISVYASMNFIAYRSSKVSSRPDYIHQLWQSGFSRVYSNCCCSFEPEIIKTGQLFNKTYTNNKVNFQESRTILNSCTKKVWKPIEGTRYVCLYLGVCIYRSMCVCVCVCLICVYVRVFICMNVCVYKCLWIYVYICVYVLVFVNVYECVCL